MTAFQWAASAWRYINSHTRLRQVELGRAVSSGRAICSFYQPAFGTKQVEIFYPVNLELQAYKGFTQGHRLQRGFLFSILRWRKLAMHIFIAPQSQHLQ